MTQCPQSNDPPTINAPGECIARWRICLHEAGHAVAMRHNADQKVTAVVFDRHYGAAYQDGREDHVGTVEDALVTAAGKAAEMLVTSCPPPHFAPPPSLKATHPEVVEMLLGDIKATAVSDAVKLARWSIRHVEDRPHRWARNYYLLMERADAFVREHQYEIVEIATGLYARGIITLPASPAMEGKNHVA